MGWGGATDLKRGIAGHGCYEGRKRNVGNMEGEISNVRGRVQIGGGRHGNDVNVVLVYEILKKYSKGKSSLVCFQVSQSINTKTAQL